jgi:Uma2 family endonuclease
MQTAKIDRTKEWTVDDYLMLGEMNTPCQLIDGELIISPSPTTLHQRVLRELFKLFDECSDGKGEILFAPIDLFIDRKNVFQPDLVYISDLNKSIIRCRGIEGPPDIAVEIMSPSNLFTDRNTKKKKYLAFGVKEYWIVDPINQSLEIYLCDQADHEVPHLYLAGEGKVTSTVISELEFDLKTIF